jgi:hypothetical protein
MLRLHPECVHDRTRALTFEARARRRKRPDAAPVGAPPWRFLEPAPALFCCFFPWDQAAFLPAAVVDGPGDAGRPSVGAVANRAGDATTLLSLSGSPLEKTPLDEQG